MQVGKVKCRLNANWRLPTRTYVNLVRSKVYHVERPPYLFAARSPWCSASRGFVSDSWSLFKQTSWCKSGLFPYSILTCGFLVTFYTRCRRSSVVIYSLLWSKWPFPVLLLSMNWSIDRLIDDNSLYAGDVSALYRYSLHRPAMYAAHSSLQPQ